MYLETSGRKAALASLLICVGVGRRALEDDEVDDAIQFRGREQQGRFLCLLELWLFGR